jgi:hypothetical protein
MLRLLLGVVSLGLLAAFPVLAQQPQHHVVSGPETLSWVEPPTFRARLPIVHGKTVIQVHGTGPTDITFVNPADDPGKK